MISRVLKLLSVTVLVSAPLFSMVSDHRYFPFYPQPFSRVAEQPSRCALGLFVTTADKAFNSMESEIAIPALYGEYNQVKLSKALSLVGKDNPMPVEFRQLDIPWDIEATIQAQGVSFAYEQSLLSPVSVGFTWLLMHLHACHDFCLHSSDSLKEPGDIAQLKEARRLMHKELGLTKMQSNVTGMGDFDAYVRIGNIWDYVWKCRQIDAGFSLGLIIPSGLKRDLCNATMVPFGGNGHWGMYGRVDAEFELKEDMKCGFDLRLGKRFKKTYDMRLTVADEHPLYGALIAPVEVDPGVNFSFFPYVSLENLRKGLGVRVGLNLTKQTETSFFDRRSPGERTVLPASAEALRKISKWGADYAFLNVFYDFGKVDVERGHKPTITFTWDFPFSMFIASNVIKTHRISLGVEVNF